MPHAAAGPQDITLLRLLRGAIRRRRLLIRLPLGLVALVLVVSLVLPRKYTAWAAFTPEASTNQLSSLAGVAAEFGVNLPQTDNTQSPDFYAALVTTPTFLNQLVAGPYQVQTSAGPVTYQMDSVLDVDEGSAPATLARTAELLGRYLNAKVDPTSGVVELTVTLPVRELSLAVIERALSQIQTFNVETRQSQARWERAFIEQRLGAATEELGSAEDRFGAFLQRNRDYRNSPQLQFEADRLQRSVSLRQDVLTTLARSLEQAKIDEVKASPVLTMVEPATVGPRPDRRHLALKSVLAGVFGLVLAVLIAVGGEYYKALASDDVEAASEVSDAFAQARNQWHSVASRVTELWRGHRSES